MARVGDPDQIWSTRKAIVALFSYIVWQDRRGDHRLVDVFLGIAKAPRIGTLLTEPITMLFEEASSDPPNRVVTLLSPYTEWEFQFGGDTVTWWAAAVMTVPYTEEVGQSVVDTMLQIASAHHLESYIPTDIWAWLKKRPSLPPICEGRSVGIRAYVVRTVRGLGDVEILESYLLLVWSEWNDISSWGFAEMCTSIREDLGGIGVDRKVLIKRLDHVLGELDRGLEHFKQCNPSLNERHIPAAREQYKKLKEILLEADREALEILTRTSFRLITSFNPLTRAQNHTRHLFAPFLSHVRSRAHNTRPSFPQLRASFAHCGFPSVTSSGSVNPQWEGSQYTLFSSLHCPV